jgi:hypothetical protein
MWASGFVMVLGAPSILSSVLVHLHDVDTTNCLLHIGQLGGMVGQLLYSLMLASTPSHIDRCCFSHAAGFEHLMALVPENYRNIGTQVVLFFIKAPHVTGF